MKASIKRIILGALLLVSFFYAGSAGAQSPTILQSYVSQTSASSAVLNTEINPNGYLSTMWFEFGQDRNLNSWQETEHMVINAVSYTVPFSRNVIGLAPNTTYYFRAVTDNGRGTIKGNIFSFVTNPSVATNVSQNTYTNQNTTTIIKGEATKNLSASANTSGFSIKSTANAIFGEGFLPSTVLGWLVIILILIIIVIIVRRSFGGEK